MFVFSRQCHAPAGKLVLTIFAGLGEFERTLILERQVEGIAIAKQKGKHLGRKKAVVDEKRFIELYNGWKAGHYLQKKIMDEFKISREWNIRTVHQEEYDNSADHSEYRRFLKGNFPFITLEEPKDQNQ